ncbi:hypothetical protein ACFT30_08310 [Microbacterium ureisolvens]|uniref:hypothetical protein n=1 Tax=Microbacterium ureisolvens TaxID=2781186 RepID=UPI0036313EA5
MRLIAYLLSCAARRAVLRDTLHSLSLSDWSSPVHVVEDSATGGRAQTNQEFNALELLNRFSVNSDADVLVFAEDDLVFNSFIEHNLRAWTPLGRSLGSQFFGSVYNPGIRPLRSRDAEMGAYFYAEPDRVYGSQCFVLSRPTAVYVRDHYWEINGGQDIKLSRLAARVTPIFYHRPSLVQHVGEVSTWGGRMHRAIDFDQNWRAEVRRDSHDSSP